MYSRKEVQMNSEIRKGVNNAVLKGLPHLSVDVVE